MGSAAVEPVAHSCSSGLSVHTPIAGMAVAPGGLPDLGSLSLDFAELPPVAARAPPRAPAVSEVEAVAVVDFGGTAAAASGLLGPKSAISFAADADAMAKLVHRDLFWALADDEDDMGQFTAAEKLKAIREMKQQQQQAAHAEEPK